MFESIRKHSKIFMVLLFLLIIPSFVLVGIDSNYFTEKSPVVASVNGQDITQAEWENAHKIEADRVRAQSPSVDPKLLDSPQARYATLERMVRDRVYAAAAEKMHLVTSDVRLARTLQSMPAIATLKRPDGSLDAEAYRALVGAQGMTPEGFEASVRRDLSLNQVMSRVVDSGVASSVEVRLAMDAFYQAREIQIARWKPADFASKVSVTDAELATYYEAHPEKFQEPERAQIEYLVLDLDAVRAGLVLGEEDLRRYYKENLERLASKEERRASHILINASKTSAASDRTAAKERAMEILDKVRKSPSEFAVLAQKFSEDAGSASAGGDLGYFARGAMVRPFEDAAFALKKGEISELVESEFGFHILLITDIKTPRAPTFEELRSNLEADLKQQLAQRKYAEVAELFANSVYEQADSLQPVAQKLGLKLQSAQGLSRQPATPLSGVLGNAKFLEALFAADSLEKRRNTEALEIGPNQMVAGRIVSYTSATRLAFATVKDQLRQLVVAEKSAAMARAEGESQLKLWQSMPASTSVGALSSPITVSRLQFADVPRPAVEKAMRASIDQLPAWFGVDLGLDGYAVVKLQRVVPREAPSPALAAQQAIQYQRFRASAEAAAYYEFLKQRFGVQFKVPQPADAVF